MCFRNLFILAALLGFPAVLMDNSFRNETVQSAEYYNRNLASSCSCSNGSLSSGFGCSFGADHSGVVLHTKEGNDWLLHHPGPSSLTVVTDAKHMSKNWVKDHDIPVVGEKTVQEVYKAAEGRTTNPVINYITGGTCKGVAHNAEKYLKEEKKDTKER